MKTLDNILLERKWALNDLYGCVKIICFLKLIYNVLNWWQCDLNFHKAPTGIIIAQKENLWHHAYSNAPPCYKHNYKGVWADRKNTCAPHRKEEKVYYFKRKQ